MHAHRKKGLYNFPQPVSKLHPKLNFPKSRTDEHLPPSRFIFVFTFCSARSMLLRLYKPPQM